MKLYPAICVFVLALVHFTSPSLNAGENNKVAILEFQNKAETIITTNRWTMAEDLAKKMGKKNKTIQTVRRKEILKQLKELSWNGDRLEEAQEGKLASLGVRYLVYGNIAHWRVQGASTGGEVQDAAEARVIFSIDVLDLTSRKSIKSFIVDGNASGEVGNIREGDPASFDESKYDQEIYDATDIALTKAAEILSELLAK